MVVEATARHEWLLLSIENRAERCVLAHPKKLRVIADSANKTDKIDAPAPGASSPPAVSCNQSSTASCYRSRVI